MGGLFLDIELFWKDGFMASFDGQTAVRFIALFLRTDAFFKMALLLTAQLRSTRMNLAFIANSR